MKYTTLLTLAVLTLGCGKGNENKGTVAEPQVIEPDRPSPEEQKPAPDKPAAPDPNAPPSTDAPDDVAAPPAGTSKTKSGIAWRVLRKGAGTKKPGDEDTVLVHYNSWATDGKLKHSTYKKGQPRELELEKAVSGWRQSIQLMVVGERRRVWIPRKLAHTRSKRRNKRYGMRVIDFELVKVKRPPKAPADVKRPPKGAKRTASGLAYKELKAGAGDANPGPKSQVVVRYAGWTTNGKCFDYTGDDESMTFGLDRVVPGWTEGIQLMTAGQKMRMWIPKKLAYDGVPGKPKGMLVFEIELLEFENAQGAGADGG